MQTQRRLLRVLGATLLWVNECSAGPAVEVPATPRGARLAVEMVEQETVGPFSTWADVRKAYGAAGDGVTDDTAAIQRGLNDLGRPGKPQVLYFPPGTYKLTATLLLTGLQWRGSGNFRWGGVSLIGDSPTTTRIKWFGPPGTAMLTQDGGFGTRYSRLTWDGSATAQYGIAQWWNTTEGHVYGGGTEHQDEVFQDMAIGIMAGRPRVTPLVKKKSKPGCA